MLQAARVKNPNLIVVSELFDNNPELNTKCATALNINYVSHEIQNLKSCKELAEFYQKTNNGSSGLQNIDSLENLTKEATFPINFDISSRPFKYLSASSPSTIIYDCSLDNVSTLENYGNEKMSLPLLTFNSSMDSAVASVWGFDYNIKKQIN